MRLCVVCPHFAPDLAPTGEVMTSIVHELVARGHELHVVTALPWYQHHRVEEGWSGRLVRREPMPWGAITRVHPFPTDKTNIPARALAFGGFTVLAAAMGLAGGSFTRRSSTRWAGPEAVLAMSPPLTLGLAGWAVASAHRVPFVFNIQDVFPDVAVELGLLKGRRVIAAASWLEQLTYLRADAVTVLSEDLRANVETKIARRVVPGDDRVQVIPNFIDTDRIVPAERENGYRREYGLSGRTVVMYAGNVGFSQSLDLVLHAAADMVDDDRVVFVINGGGSARPGLEERARHLPNVCFVDMQPKARLPEVLAAGDIHVVPLKRGLARSSVPSKMYSILAAGRPIVASVDPGTEVARTVTAAGAGMAVGPDDPHAFTAAVRHLVEAPEAAAAMGVAGRRFVQRWASPAAVAGAYEELFADLADRRRR
ncbi:WcaI family glycosyltransferase [soil metagenome]